MLMIQDAALTALKKAGWWRCQVVGQLEGAFGCAIKGIRSDCRLGSLSMSMMLCSKGMLDSRLFCI